MQPPPRPGLPQVFPVYAPPGMRPPLPVIPSPQIVRQPTTSSAIPVHSTTLWVGKIAPSINASTMRKILETCGTIKEWKPATDPKTGTMKGFGFCTYHQPDSVIVALDLLNGMLVDGQALALKCNSATEQYISWYRDSSTSKKGKEKISAELEASKESAKEKIDGILQGRPYVQPPKDASAAASDFLASLDTTTTSTTTTSTTAPAATMHGHPSMAPAQRKTPPAHAKEPSMARRIEKRGREEEDREEDERERHARRAKQAELAKEREEARLYKERVHKWEMRERERIRDHNRSIEKERDIFNERQRQIKIDNENAGRENEGVEIGEHPIERKLYCHSKEAAARRRRREREKQYEEEDILLEIKRDQERREKKEQELKLAAEKAKAAIVAAQALSNLPPPSQQQQAPAIVVVDTTRHAQQQQQQQQQQRRQKGAATAVGFDDEDEDKNKNGDAERKLIPIKYSDEELRGVTKTNPVVAETAGSEAIKRQCIISKIPKDQEGVFAYPVKWNYYDCADNAVKKKISSWVSKKIKELMGEEETSFCQFIMTSIESHDSAQELFGKLQDVLDEDAHSFVTKLFQVIIYETEKIATGT